MKRFLLIICLSGVLNAIGQISPGTVASDFTVQDITGNSYNLYNELDSGKTVLLHCFAAWDSFAWEYYQQHVLEAFNSLYGEPGNGSVAIWRVECETQNSTAQLQGPASNTGNIERIHRVIGFQNRRFLFLMTLRWRLNSHCLIYP